MNTEFTKLLTKIVLPSLWDTLLMVTVAMILSTIIGLILAIVLVVTDDRGLKPNKVVYEVLSVIINIIRSFPFIILMVAIIPFTRMLVGTSIGIQAAIVPLTIAASAFIARLLEGNLKEVNSSLIEAAKSFGASNTQIIFKVMIVEALPGMISNLTLSVVSVLGSTAMAGTVGAGGLGAVALTYGYQNFNDQIMYSTVFILIIVVQFIQVLGNVIYKKIR